MSENQLKILQVLTPILFLAIVTASVFGAFVTSTYERETASMAAQGIGQDLFDLFIVAPVLLILVYLMKKGSRIALFLYGGALYYVLYSFVIYSMGIHFNQMFLVYCMVLGLSTFSFIVYFYGLDKRVTREWFDEKVPVYATGIYLIVVAILFYFTWLNEVLPAVIDNTIPKSVKGYGLLVNPVHVLDISIALPGLIISAILLMRKHSMGFLLAPINLVFTIFMALALVAMGIMMKIKNINDDISIVYIFSVIALISIGFLAGILAKLKKTDA